MKRIIPFLLLAFVAVACERDGPTVPVDGPQFGKGKPNCDEDPSHPSCKDDGGGGGDTAQLDMCAKRTVVDEINTMKEDGTDGLINSTAPDCECGPVSEYWGQFCPQGTFEYTTAGPKFQWKFSGSGFVPISHEYNVIVYRDDWPGRDLICLGSFRAKRRGQVNIVSSMDLGEDLAAAKIWIVHRDWLDCDGNGFRYRDNPDGVPRLTNDRDGVGPTDATEFCAPEKGAPDMPECDELAYDWLFETALIDYDDTDVN
jgi:hypothetical protein